MDDDRLDQAVRLAGMTDRRLGCAYTGAAAAMSERPNRGWRQPSEWLREDWLDEDADALRAAAAPPTDHPPTEDEYR